MAGMGERSSPCEVLLDGGDTEEDLRRNHSLKKDSTKFPHRLPQQAIYRGMLLNEFVHFEGLKSARAIELRKDDIMVCGYPRSGTTWLENILYLIANDVKESEICPRAFWFDDDSFHKDFCDLPSPRLMKSHIPVELFPPTAFKNKTRLILAIRNPKDVTVAFYHFYHWHTDFGQFPGSFDEFFDMFVQGYIHWGDWTSHTNDWWTAVKNHDNIMPVFYKDQKEKPREVIRNLGRFCGKELTDDQIEMIVEKTSFSQMKATYTAEKPFVRKGIVGDWKNHFNDEQRRKFDTWITENIKHKDLLERLHVV